MRVPERMIRPPGVRVWDARMKADGEEGSAVRVMSGSVSARGRAGREVMVGGAAGAGVVGEESSVWEFDGGGAAFKKEAVMIGGLLTLVVGSGLLLVDGSGVGELFPEEFCVGGLFAAGEVCVTEFEVGGDGTKSLFGLGSGISGED